MSNEHHDDGHNDVTHEGGHHDAHDGGHELEALNTKLLFRLMISLSLVTLLASMAVVQWYYSQRRELQETYAIEGSVMLAQYKEQMAKDIEGIDVVRRQILADGKVLLAPPPPANWVHPDDQLGGGGAPAVDPSIPSTPDAGPGPAPTPDPGIVVEGGPAGIAVPAGDAKPEAGRPEGAGQPEGRVDEPRDDKSDYEKPGEKPADKLGDKPVDKPGNE